MCGAQRPTTCHYWDGDNEDLRPALKSYWEVPLNKGPLDAQPPVYSKAPSAGSQSSLSRAQSSMLVHAPSGVHVHNRCTQRGSPRVAIP